MRQFFQSVGNVNNPSSFIPQLSDDPEKIIDLFGCKRRRRLVHDQNPSINRKSFCNLHHLLFRHRKISNHLIWADINVKIVQDLFCFLLHLAVVQGNTALNLPAKEHVLCYRQMTAHIQFLMNDSDSGCLRLLWCQVLVGFPENFHCALIPGIYTAEDLHQCRFTCTIFSQQRHNFSRTQLKFHMIQGFYTWKTFADIVHGDNDLIHSIPSLICFAFLC